MRSLSKVKNVFGEADKLKFEDIKPSETTTDGQIIDVNTHFLAISWATGGAGIISIVNNNEFMRVPTDQNFIRGHSASITDVKFSPFKSNLLATSCEDATLRIFNIPQEGLTKHIDEPIQFYQMHQKKINNCNWNPSVSEIIASAGVDNKINIYNILSPDVITSFSLTNTPMCVEWNDVGSLIGTTTKDKNLSICDPRSKKNEISFKCHDSSRYQKMIWLTGDICLSVGFSSSNDRQLKLWDLKKFSAPLKTEKIDSMTGMIMPSFDADTNMIYLPAKGEGNVRFYEYRDNSVGFIGEYRSTVAQKNMAFFPKRSMNYKKCEISRMAKLTSNSVEYISFYIPKRVEGYHSEIYPDCFSGIPSINVEQWLGGETKAAVRKSIISMESKWTSIDEISNIEKSSKIIENPKIGHSPVKINDDMERKVTKLNKEVESLNATIKEDKEIIELLSLKCVSNEEEINSLQEKIQEMNEIMEKMMNEIDDKNKIIEKFQSVSVPVQENETEQIK